MLRVLWGEGFRTGTLGARTQEFCGPFSPPLEEPSLPPLRVEEVKPGGSPPNVDGTPHSSPHLVRAPRFSPSSTDTQTLTQATQPPPDTHAPTTALGDGSPWLGETVGTRLGWGGYKQEADLAFLGTWSPISMPGRWRSPAARRELEGRSPFSDSPCAAPRPPGGLALPAPPHSGPFLLCPL